MQGSTAFPAVVSPGSTLRLSGLRFRGSSEATGGGGGGSASDVPQATLSGPLGATSCSTSSGEGACTVLSTSAFASGGQLDVSLPGSGSLAAGLYLLRVTVNGVPSEARLVSVP